MSTFNSRQEPFGTFALHGYKKSLLNLAQSLNRNWLNFKFGLVLRKMVLQNKVKVVDAEALGIKARFYPLDNLGDRYMLFLPNFYEYIEFDLLAKTLKPSDVFVDIGANMGIYSIWASRFISESGRVLALEPNPICYERLNYNVSLNPHASKVTALQVGVADRATSFELSLDPTNLGGATIMENKNQYKVTIQCQPLLAILEEQGIKHIDALKIDIEGAEAVALNQFFKDAPRSLYPRMILIETTDNIDFDGLGYTFIERTKTHNSIFKLRN